MLVQLERGLVTTSCDPVYAGATLAKLLENDINKSKLCKLYDGEEAGREKNATVEEKGKSRYLRRMINFWV